MDLYTQIDDDLVTKMNFFKKNISHILCRINNFIYIQKLLSNGVDILFPNTIEVRGELITKGKIKIERNIIFAGSVTLEDGVIIESNCFLKDCIIRSGTIIKSHSRLNGCEININSSIGPYARIRPDTFIGRDSQIGNFVEIKKSTIGSNAKINHLSYIGDSEIGDNVIIGAGCVTCNYDGVETQKTYIEDSAFIGSGVFLIAPVKVGKSSTIGSGSIITDDVPSEKLTLARTKQKTIDNWNRPKK